MKTKILIEKIEEMSDTTRESLSKSNFVFPDERRWPIKPKKYAIAAIKYMWMGRGTSADYPKVIGAIKKEYSDDNDVMEFLKDHMDEIEAKG